MRLKHIKLSGFKSFVDPTKVPFEQQMTAIVGPNGCGKSNIIDAVRWVLGESSAKNLRGDAMTDVIFNGAASRKSVGQASVELVFDNVKGRIQGSLADRSQISIRRVVNRDSQNSYFLNGAKCRRRDITDIFLGTGLGPRSYAIIEQGTISRLIESKPQELRIFIEEAAGISRYKERRKETEVRIKHTRENLTRLTDLRIELSGHIEKLHSQAEAAKRFRTLKAQERKYKAELALLRWQKYDSQHAELNESITCVTEQINDVNRQQKTIEIDLFTLKQQSNNQHNLLTEKQQDKLGLAQKIAHAEQNTKHIQQHTSRLVKDNEKAQEQLINAQKLQLQEKEKVTRNQKLIDEIEPKLIVEKQEETALNTTLLELKKQKENIESQLRKIREHIKSSAEQQNIVQQSLIQKEALFNQNNLQLARIAKHIQILEEKADGGIASLTEKLALKRSHLAEVKRNQQNKTAQLTRLKASISKHEHNAIVIENNLAALTEKYNELSEKLQHDQTYLLSIKETLNQNDIAQFGTVQSGIEIVTGWELPVQMVLAEFLSALWVETLPEFPIEDGCHLIKSAAIQPAIKPNTLAEKVKGCHQLTTLLNKVHIVDDAQDVNARLAQIEPDESVISKSGVWRSSTFIRNGIHQVDDQYLMIKTALTRLENETAKVQAERDHVVIEKSAKQDEIASCIEALSSLEQEVAKEQQAVIDTDKALSIALHNAQADQQQLQRLLNEKKDIEQSQSTLLADFTRLKEKVAAFQTKYHEISSHSEEDLLAQLSSINHEIDSANLQFKNCREKLHSFELQMQKESSTVTQCEQNIVRLQENINHLIEQQEKAQFELTDNRRQLQQDKVNLSTWLQDIAKVEQSISSLQMVLSKEQTAVDNNNAMLKSLANELKALEQKKSQLMIECEGAKLRASSAMEQLTEQDIAVAEVRKNMPQHAKESQWQGQLIRLAKDIATLGSINLAAIEEYESQLARKNYLDQQDQDLNFAITTLESAIEKIDKESRQKFKATFDRVNQDLKRLFPKVFGGGQAYLALTGDDLLETGVTIMARPPGKKNSTIHLLSGGEKALTALSLVFAIFRLNPAPFCMLDEVDAPLDDANVERFCNLVKEMSNTVQFIYISHNKIAMEMASHLTGVTMFEPGVSRMVAVDIDEAIAMADVS